ncbi:MAG TPA: hypothetical protein VMK12_17775 [Anaeromyxobacteraceae bacterium]|nr:hypothetical protein [Anaeromyxobacteraceae bacterium]
MPKTAVRKDKRRSTAPKANAFLACTTEEREQLLNDLQALRSDRIQGFLEVHGLPKTGTKPELAKRALQAVENTGISLDAFAEFLDGQALWGKQHVFLLGSPASRGSPRLDPREWGDKEWLRVHLADHRLSSRLNQRRPLVLPQQLELVTIEGSQLALRAVAVRRREGWERVEELDEERVDETDGDIKLRAFKKVITRGLISFEWDLANNVAMVQITQLPTHIHYEDVQAEFAALVSKWLPLERFPPVSLGPAVASLYAEAKKVGSDVRSHGVEFEALDGRRLHGKSKRAKQPLEGNAIIDAALESMSKSNGIGNQGNFFFQVRAVGARTVDDEAHVIVWASDINRINFTTPQDEATVRDVLQRIRAACRE